MNGDTVYYTIPIVKSMKKAYASSGVYDEHTSPHQQQIFSIFVSVNGEKNITFTSSWMMHVHGAVSAPHSGGDNQKISKIIGKM